MGNISLQQATTSRSFKCAKCGNMFAIDDRNEGKCDVCGNACTLDTCMVIEASNEGY
ncbi:hypothetical protein D3C86_1705110 [compost metagenome]